MVYTSVATNNTPYYDAHNSILCLNLTIDCYTPHNILLILFGVEISHNAFIVQKPKSKANDKEYDQAHYLLMIFTNKEAANYDTY